MRKNTIDVRMNNMKKEHFFSRYMLRLGVIYIVSMGLLLNGCATVTTYPSLALSKQQEIYGFDLIIDIGPVRDNEFAGRVAASLKDNFKTVFRDVSITDSHNYGKANEVVLSIRGISCNAEGGYAGKADAVINYTFIVDGNARPSSISSRGFAVMGQGQQLLIMLLGIPFVFVGGVFAVEFIHKTSARSGALNSAVAGIYNDVINSQSDRLAMLKEQLAAPSVLTLSAKFSDASSFLSNNALDAGESTELIVSVNNTGKGTGFGTALIISSNNSKIAFDKEVSAGDILPGESKELRIPVKAALDLADGKAEFMLNIIEKRKYDSNKVRLNIQTVKLEKPKLEIVSTEIEDGNIGLAKGNGNHVIESGETIELTAFIRNSGVGPALGVNLVGSDMTTGVTWLSGHDTVFVGTIAPGETSKAKISFSVPPNFDAKSITANLRVADVRPIDKAEYQFAQGYSKKSPDLQYAYQLYLKGAKVSTITNGGEYEVELAISNKGQMAAKSVAVNVSTGGGISVSRSRMDIGDVKEKDAALSQRFKLSVPRTYSTTQAPLSIEIAQAYFPSTKTTVQIPVEAKSPQLSYTANLVSRNRGNTLEQREPAMLEVGSELGSTLMRGNSRDVSHP